MKDGLLLQQADDLRIVPLLKLAFEALRFRARPSALQRIGAEVQSPRAAVVAVAKLKRNLALGRDAHAQAVAVAAKGSAASRPDPPCLRRCRSASTCRRRRTCGVGRTWACGNRAALVETRDYRRWPTPGWHTAAMPELPDITVYA